MHCTDETRRIARDAYRKWGPPVRWRAGRVATDAGLLQRNADSGLRLPRHSSQTLVTEKEPLRACCL